MDKFLKILPPAGVAVLLAIGLLFMPRAAAATTCAWTGAVDTDWANAGNWSGCLVSPPGATDAVVIDSQANQPVMGGGTTDTLSALTLNPGATLQVSGRLTTTDATVGGVLNIQSGGLLSLDTGSSTVSGTLGVQAGGLAQFNLLNGNATVMAAGVLSGAGDLLLTNTGLGPGQLVVNSAANLGGLTLGRDGIANFNAPAVLARLSLTDTASYLQGTADVTVTQAMSFTNGYLLGNGTLFIAPSATLTVDTPGFLSVSGSRKLHNFGTMNWLRGSFSAAGTAFENETGGVFNLVNDAHLATHFNNYGALNILGSTLSTDGNNVRNWSGVVTLNSGNIIGAVQVYSGTLQGTGVITGGVNNYGTFAPGNPLGTLTVNGPFVEEPSGTLSFDLGGTLPGAGYDVFNVSGGQTTLNGTLVINQINGFLANAGDVFTLMNYTTLNPSQHFMTITNPISLTQPATVYDHQVVLAATPLQTRLSVRPNRPVSRLIDTNGYTVAVFNPTTLTGTVQTITDTVAAGFTYVPGTTTGATTAEPNVSMVSGQQVLVWPGPFTLAPTTGITVNFGVSMALAYSGTYLDSAAIDASLYVTDTRQVAVNGVAPIIVVVPVSDNIAVSAQGAKVQNTTPPQILIRRAAAGTVPITVIAHIVCPFTSCGTLQHVFLVHGPLTVTMTSISSTMPSLANGPAQVSDYGFWNGTIPGEGVIPGVPMTIFPDWDDHHPCSGSEQNGCAPGDPGPGTPSLYDPSGHVTDANTGLPIPGASVTLYRALALQPDTRTVTNGCRTVNTRPGGIGGTWDNVPAASLGQGSLEDPLFSPAQIDPAVNPQLTDDQGHFGWNVVTGCWFVMASAPGYASKVSPPVGVPPEVTDLNIALQPLAPQNKLYLPLVRR